MKDFRDQHIEEALKETVGAWRPERTLRARLRRMAVVAALALATAFAIWTVLDKSGPKPSKPAPRKPVAVEILPAPATR